MTGLVDGKVALVTGAGSGIGRATAIVFAREGAKVVVADVDVKGGSETVHEIEASGGEALFVTADVSRSEAVEGCGRGDVVTTPTRFHRLLQFSIQVTIIPSLADRPRPDMPILRVPKSRSWRGGGWGNRCG